MSEKSLRGFLSFGKDPEYAQGAVIALQSVVLGMPDLGDSHIEFLRGLYGAAVDAVVGAEGVSGPFDDLLEMRADPEGFIAKVNAEVSR